MKQQLNITLEPALVKLVKERVKENQAALKVPDSISGLIKQAVIDYLKPGNDCRNEHKL